MISIRIAGVSIMLAGIDKGSLPIAYLSFAEENSMDADIFVEITPVQKHIEIADSCKVSRGSHWSELRKNPILFFTLSGKPLANADSKDICKMRCSSDFAYAKVEVPFSSISNGLFEALMTRSWLRHLYSGYCSEKDIYVVHGALIRYMDKGFAILGPSGAGKTTFCNFVKAIPQVEVLADDRFVARLHRCGVVAHGAPWNFSANGCFKNQLTSLSKCCFISRQKNNALEKVHMAKAIQLMANQVLLSCCPERYEGRKERVIAAHRLLSLTEDCCRFTFLLSDNSTNFIKEKVFEIEHE